MIFLLEKAIRK